MFFTSKQFWKQTAERALKSGAQFVALVIGAGVIAGTQPGEAAEVINAFALDWLNLGGVFLGGAFASIVTSIASAQIGADKESPSLVSTE